jgi:alpha-tubulin suppressor-like RCC1 family protein
MRCQAGLCQSLASAFVTSMSSFARAPDGAFRAWGANNTGQLGDGTLTNRLTPAATMLPATAVEVVGGYSHTCARLMDGTVMCWGYNSQGQVGIGPMSTTARPTPAAVPGLVGARSVATGSNHTCAVRADGTVVCWGANNSMQLGTRDSAVRAVPTPVLGLTGNFVAVSAGITHTCARRDDGAVFCWGLNSSGQLGNGTTAGTGPVMVTGVVATDIAAGYFNTCARLADGSVRCWGNNTYGQIGDGTVAMRPSPTAVRTAGPVAEIHIGGAFTCARLMSGTIQCWGYNRNGSLGDGTTTQRPSPAAVMGITDAVSLALDNSNHVCARLATGALRCWGYNRNGAVGDGSVVSRLVPVVVPGV